MFRPSCVDVKLRVVAPGVCERVALVGVGVRGPVCRAECPSRKGGCAFPVKPVQFGKFAGGVATGSDAIGLMLGALVSSSGGREVFFADGV